MSNVIQTIQAAQMKKSVVDARSGDTVRVHQKIIEGSKERVQIFEGLVINANRKNSLTSSITVRRIASGVGVEKTFLVHSPSVLKIEITKRSKVRRNYLGYMRRLTGKSARLIGVDFDKQSVNATHDEQAEEEEAKLREQAEAEHEREAAKKAEEEAKVEAKVEAALASHEPVPESKEDK